MKVFLLCLVMALPSAAADLLAGASAVNITPPEQFQYGAYETWRMRTSPLETNAILKMTDCFLGLLKELR